MPKKWNLEDSGSDSGVKQEYTTFPVGITRIRVIDEVPVKKFIHWIQDQKRAVTCPGRGCPICEIRRRQKANKEPQTYNMAKRLGMQVINRETGNREIMEQGITFYKDLEAVMEDLADDEQELIDADLRVKRRGTGKDDTVYRIDVDKVEPLSESDKALIAEKVDLEEFFKPHPPEMIQRIIDGEQYDEIIGEYMNKGKKEESADDEEFEVE